MYTKKDLMAATIAGEPCDRVPFSLWHHYPEIDHDPVLLANAIVEDFLHYNLDFIKMMPSGMYSTEDWGCEAVSANPVIGNTTLLRGPIDSVDDWRGLEQMDPHAGARGRELECLSRVCSEVGPTVPVLQTIFSPATTAAKIAGGGKFLEHLRSSPGKLMGALETITKTEKAYIEASFRAGAAGIFFATQFAGDSLVSRDEYRNWIMPFELEIMEDMSRKSQFSIMHLHGQNIMFDLFTDYPVSCINLEDLSVPLAERRRAYEGVIVAGLSQSTWLRKGSVADIGNHVSEVLASMGKERFILAPGCVLPLDISAERLKAAREAVGEG
jgi:uroporphyrinogen decarboxylase